MINFLEFDYGPKQRRIIQQSYKYKPQTLLLEGAVRTGKTFLLVDLFMQYVLQHKGKTFIGVGVSIGAFKRNVLDLITEKYGISFHVNKDGVCSFFGNRLIIAGGVKSDSFKPLRSLTAQGVIVNEASLLHIMTYREILARASETGARLFMDSNPDSPEHFIKKEIIDARGQRLKSGRVRALNYNFKIDDNPFLDPDYVENLKATTPPGFWYNRLISGLWTSAEGAVYTGFNPVRNIKHGLGLLDYSVASNKAIIGGIDFGFTNPFVVELAYITPVGETVFFYEESGTQKTVAGYWAGRMKHLQDRFKVDVFYCDTENPEAIEELKKAGVNAKPAYKSVNAGIDMLNTAYMTQDVYISEECKGLIAENYTYCYDLNKPGDVVIKKNDHHVDAARYAFATHHKAAKIGSSSGIRRHNRQPTRGF